MADDYLLPLSADESRPGTRQRNGEHGDGRIACPLTFLFTIPRPPSLILAPRSLKPITDCRFYCSHGSVRPCRDFQEAMLSGFFDTARHYWQNCCHTTPTTSKNNDQKPNYGYQKERSSGAMKTVERHSLEITEYAAGIGQSGLTVLRCLVNHIQNRETAGSIRVNIHLRRPSLPPFQFHP
jgi:hypothetical protein